MGNIEITFLNTIHYQIRCLYGYYYVYKYKCHELERKAAMTLLAISLVAS